MPPSSIKTLMARLDTLEEKMHLHFEESGGIKTDLAWIKKALWTMGGVFLTFTGTLVLYLLTH